MKDPFSLDEPIVEQPRNKPRMLEAYIQETCVRYARSKDYWARKFSSPSQRSVPDYLFGKQFKNYVDSATRRRVKKVKWAEEFKAEGKGPTEKQEKEQAGMREVGWLVFPDTGRRGQADIDAFKARIDALEEKYG